ncbi:MAG: hypothetical protein V7K67_02165 [Nostoc sp.]
MIANRQIIETYDQILESRKQFFIDEMVEVLGYPADCRPQLQAIFEAIYGQSVSDNLKVYTNFLLCLMGKP